MAKKIFTYSLIAFVAASLAFMVSRDNKCPCGCGGSTCTATSQPAVKPQAEFVVAYYLIGPKRCDTCRKLEAWTRDAVEKNFAADLKSGKMVFSVINTDEPQNAHWVKDFDMSFKTVVISQLKDGKVVRHERFDDVWKYVKENQAVYDAYLADGITQFMKGTPQ
jgi:hypothetical protein